MKKGGIPAGSILNVVGNTPLIEIEGIKAKLETTNPSGSIKDRMALHILKKAEERKEIKKGQRILEVTSGNTGIAFAMLAAIKGYKFTAVMPESMSIERRKIMQAFGAELILTPAEEDVVGAIKVYKELAEKNPDYWLPKQFENPDNLEAHRIGLGRELINEVKDLDAFVAGIGTGGSLLGTALALKEFNPEVKIVGVEPSESAVLSGKKPGLHKIQGIGEGFIPELVEKNMHLIDEVIEVKSSDAIEMQKKLTCKGILAGISSGANILAAKKIKEKKSKT